MHIVAHAITQGVNSRAIFFIVVFGQRLGVKHRRTIKVRLSLGEVGQAATSCGLNNGVHLFAARKIHHTHQSGIHAIGVQVVFARHFYVRIFLAEHGKNGVGMTLHIVDKRFALLASYQYRCEHAREKHHIACG